MEIRDKVVVITGASKGLGRALAQLFCKEGCRVIASSNDKEGIESIAREIGATPFTADVSRREDILNLANFALQKFGAIDIWINNAGITVPKQSLKIEEMDLDAMHRAMEVNFFGTLYGSLKALEVMNERKSGIIVNIISIRALSEYVRMGVYSASKWAVRGFTEALRREAEAGKVKIIAVFLGETKTDLWGKERPAEYDSYMKPEFAADKIIQNLMQDNPKEELIIKRPSN